jgi:hypothetical protein
MIQGPLARIQWDDSKRNQNPPEKDINSLRKYWKAVEGLRWAYHARKQNPGGRET